MAGRESQYNGWPSYETWLVFTWLTNEPVTYEDCVSLARAADDAHDAAARSLPRTGVCRVARLLLVERGRHDGGVAASAAPPPRRPARVPDFTDGLHTPDAEGDRGDIGCPRRGFHTDLD